MASSLYIMALMINHADEEEEGMDELHNWYRPTET
jgi:hypothetical protein